MRVLEGFPESLSLSPDRLRNPITIGDFDCGQGRRRSVDLRFFRPALYRLSYLTGRLIPTDRAGGNDGI